MFLINPETGNLAVEMWPIEERLTRTLGIASGLAGRRGQISLRWAYQSDIKISHARQQSKYYEKYGHRSEDLAGASTTRKRRRGDDDGDNDGAGIGGLSAVEQGRIMDMFRIGQCNLCECQAPPRKRCH